MTKLRPCPFCGSTNVEEWGNYVRCNDCLADGPFIYGAEEAAGKWNKRSTDDVMLDVADEIENYSDPRCEWIVELLRDEVSR